MEIQKTYKYLLFLIAGVLFFGAFLDAISNSVSLITLPVAVIGTLFILIIWAILEIVAKRKGIEWMLPGSNKIIIRKFNNQIRLFIIGIILTLWVPFILKPFLTKVPTISINSEELRNRRNIHDIALYVTHYLNSLLDSSNPDFFDLKVRQIDTIKNTLEKHLEFVDIIEKIKIPTDTLDSRIIFKEIIEFEKNEIKPKIRINFGVPYYYTYILSRNMWQYEYFFNIFKKTKDAETQKAIEQLKLNIMKLSQNVQFDIQQNKLDSFLDNPTTELIDEIILAK